MLVFVPPSSSKYSDVIRYLGCLKQTGNIIFKFETHGWSNTEVLAVLNRDGLLAIVQTTVVRSYSP